MVALGVLVLAVAVSRWWWGAYAYGVLQAEIDRLKGAGEPIAPDDFKLPPVPDEENAAIPLMQAARLHAQVRQEDYPQIDSQIQSLFREARLRPRQSYPLHTGHSPLPLEFAHLENNRRLQLVALASGERGDDAAALATLEDILAAGECLSSGRSLLCAFLGQTASRSVTEALERLLPALRVAPNSVIHSNEGAVSRAAVNSIIRRLSDERSLRQGMAWALRLERSVHWEHIQLVVSGRSSQSAIPTPGSSPQGLLFPLFKPMLALDATRVLQRDAAWIEGTRAERLLQAPSLPTLGSRRGFQAQASVLSRLLSLSFEEDLREVFEGIAKRRMAATALAIRLYESDHGRLPKMLDELVPRHIPAIPENPLAASGQIEYHAVADWPYLSCPGGSATVRFYLKGKPLKPTGTRPARATRPAG